MTQWHLAQLNVARLRHPIDAPETADFVANLDPINAIADAAPGFVWRLQDDSGNATSFHPEPDPLFIVNLSVWESIAALEDFVRRTAARRDPPSPPRVVRTFRRRLPRAVVDTRRARAVGRRGDDAPAPPPRARPDADRLHVPRNRFAPESSVPTSIGLTAFDRIQRQEQEMRGPTARRVFGHVVLPVHLRAAAHDQEVARPGLDVARLGRPAWTG